eukprot:4984444-Prymnesium_polylepis.3
MRRLAGTTVRWHMRRLAGTSCGRRRGSAATPAARRRLTCTSRRRRRPWPPTTYECRSECACSATHYPPQESLASSAKRVFRFQRQKLLCMLGVAPMVSAQSMSRT